MTDEARLRSVIVTLANQLGRANTHLHFFQGLLACHGELQREKDFWEYTLTAHIGMAIRDVAVVYDTHAKGVNLLNLLRGLDGCPLDRTGQMKLGTFLEAVGKCPANPLVRALRGWRNNVLAHYNHDVALSDRSEFCAKHPLDERMVQGLVDMGFEIVEWCASALAVRGGFPRFAEGKDGHLAVLQALRDRRPGS